jgi:hypothetical protein
LLSISHLIYVKSLLVLIALGITVPSHILPV